MRRLLKGLFWVAGVLAIFAVIARIFFVKVWTVPEDAVLNASMAPTLSSGDVVIVLTRGDRSFGDLVRCTDPEDGQRWVVGRISGDAGDTVSVNDRGTLTVNGRRYDTQESCKDGTYTVAHPLTGHTETLECGRVEIADSWHMRGLVPGKPITPYEHKVGEGRVFLLSDDRTFHDDSRDFGAVPKDTCKDMIAFRLWSKEGFTDSEHRFTGIR